MCRGQCNLREGVLAGIHVAVVLLSIAIAALLLVNKVHQNGVSCPYSRKYDDVHMDAWCSSDVLCDTGLYWSLLSAALSFLFVMVNWVAGVHKSLKWQRVQLILTFVGVAGMSIATIVNTSGIVLWCQNLMHQRHANGFATSHPSSCLDGAHMWDNYKVIFGGSDKGNKATEMFSLVVPAEVFHCMALILWQVMAALTVYITFYRIEEYKKSCLAAEEDNLSDVSLLDTGPSDAQAGACAYPQPAKMSKMA